MELELGRLDLRYQELRTRSAEREQRLIGSLAQVGQQTPIVVVRDGERDVVVDGYKRVRALRRLGHDIVRATSWDLGELDALVLERVLRASDTSSALEEGWFLAELVTRFGLGRDELARRFDRTTSWVSRRLGLVTDLPAPVQEHVRSGAIGPHAAMRYLVPLARANEVDCEKLAAAIAPARPSSRELGVLYAAYVSGNEQTRALVVSDPALVLRARAERDREGDATPAERLLEDLRVVSAVVRRASGRLRRGALDGASERERDLVRGARIDVRAEVTSLEQRLDQEERPDAR
jgi:ParB-like chromosome segregation protein Spo0J